MNSIDDSNILDLWIVEGPGRPSFFFARETIFEPRDSVLFVSPLTSSSSSVVKLWQRRRSRWLGSTLQGTVLRARVPWVEGTRTYA